MQFPEPVFDRIARRICLEFSIAQILLCQQMILKFSSLA